MKRRFGLLAVVVLVVGLAYVFRDHLDGRQLVAHEQALRSFVNDRPVIAWLTGFALYLVASLIPGTSGKSIFYGWLFGFWPAIVIVNISLTAAALVAFLVVRYLLSEWARRRFPGWTRRANEALERDGASYLILLRLLHAPYTLTNYVAATTAIPAYTFCWTTAVGLLPGNAAFVLAGSQLPTAEQIYARGVWELVDLRLLVALSVAACIPILVHSVARRWRGGRSSQAGADPDRRTDRADIFENKQ